VQDLNSAEALVDPADFQEGCRGHGGSPSLSDRWSTVAVPLSTVGVT
jgi:hypothetical protein